MTSADRPVPNEPGGIERVRDEIARQFHETYEWLAPQYGYKTRDESAVDWPEVPEANRKLMTHVVGNLIAEGVIQVGPRFSEARRG